MAKKKKKKNVHDPLYQIEASAIQEMLFHRPLNSSYWRYLIANVQSTIITRS